MAYGIQTPLDFQKPDFILKISHVDAGVMVPHAELT
jgi:hypothetical protein